LAALSGINFEADEHQAMSLRFIMANVDIYSLAKWLLDQDPDSGVTSVDYTDYDKVLLTTACTSDEGNWKLRPFFNLAVREGVLKPEDTEYFQIFTIPGQKDAIAFNCPRISALKKLNPLDQWDISYAYIQGRKQIRRLVTFCKNYLAGFEDAYVSQIAPMLGIRDSRRI